MEIGGTSFGVLGSDYQVFLSFRGWDTRQGFTDTLYHCLTTAGIHVFKDDDDQPMDENIEKILDTINGSAICIPILSRGYASSKRCLRELTRMVELNKKVIPIFYDVTPADVKLPTGLYMNALRGHSREIKNGKGPEQGIDAQEGSASEVQRWEGSLREVGKFTGRELRDTSYNTFCESITKEILMKLKVKQKIVPDQLIGMDDQVNAVLQLLDIEAHDVRYVGIHGIGGTGKTTLAKVVFNKLTYHFDGCSFLSDIRESSRRDGIKNLQRQLRDQIEKLAGKSNWFGTGSRIIVTTKDIRVLATERAALREGVLKQSNEVKTFEMELDFVPSLKVFSICKDKLEVTYNELDDRAKQMFLDIACFVVNKDKTNAMYMWEASNICPSIWLEDLISMSLVKIVDGNKLWMHDLVRDLGREIVHKENFVDPGGRSRLWILEEAFGTLEGEEGSEKVEAMYLSDDEQLEGKCFGYEAFECLKNLRFLEWYRFRFDGDMNRVLTKLRWLSWHNCPADFRATNLNLPNLVILDLSWSDISEAWDGWSQIKVGAKLKVLDLTGCKKLSRTPDFSEYSTLERLILANCVALTEIHSSIGKLKKLRHLNIKGSEPAIPALPLEERFSA
ncbi:hypothetical protein CRG98_026387 [Punica granatum]|uniref:TIR domain-containing protein n=1 Tax=Punica granatum TaxID=22663 RepID=A0A2I0JAG5_PUNGR|nr:hypothetical protein CRG98_026387 [Punica granatum]